MSPPKPVILLADDTAANVEFVYGILGSAYDLLVASNGREAVDLAAAESPELILMDVMMPKMDGYQSCRLLKADPRTADIPVIFLTAVSDIGSVIEGFECGGVDYIIKPFHAQELLVRTRTHLSLRQALAAERALRVDLESALLKVKQLSGLLPICANCKNIRDEMGSWNSLESFIAAHSEASFTHSICPACARQLYGLNLEDIAKDHPIKPS